jgi:carboxyl-terminal processing protease
MGATRRTTEALTAVTWLAIGCLGTLVALGLAERLGWGRRPQPTELLGEVQGLIERHYVHGATEDQLIDGALHGMLGGLDDYSRYYDRNESAAFENETAGIYAGVGIRFTRSSALTEVLCALPDSPAERAGIRPGDRLLRVDGLEVSESEPNELRERLANVERRPVQVELETRTGQRRRVELTPEQVTDPTVRHTLFLEETEGLAYVHVRGFSRRTGAEFDAAVEALRERDLRGLVLDLRGNLGGVLDSALEIADRFLDGGVLLQVESRNGVEEHLAQAPETWLANLPLVVLVDGESASASEVLAGALQDHRAAVLVGERTYGKGTVQTLTRLPATSGVLKLTTSLYRTPAGRRIERSLDTGRRHGLAPDVEVELSDDEALALHVFHQDYTPRPELADVIHAWERESGRSLLPRPPRDPQLTLAIELLSGRRPQLAGGLDGIAPGTNAPPSRPR